MGNRIRELRTNMSLSQEQLADKLGVTKQAISQMERGVRKPSMEMLDALCDFFNVSADYLRGIEDITIRLVDGEGIQKLDGEWHHINPETKDIAQTIYDDPDLHALFDAARGSNPDNLKLAAEMLKRMKETNNDG
jgi:transcriptional regulator with XRE-family HTH domain